MHLFNAIHDLLVVGIEAVSSVGLESLAETRTPLLVLGGFGPGDVTFGVAAQDKVAVDLGSVVDDKVAEENTGVGPVNEVGPVGNYCNLRIGFRCRDGLLGAVGV